jgi:hypothetical protein
MAAKPGSSLVAKLDPAITRLVVGILAIGLLGWAGFRSAKRAAATRTQLRTAEAALASFADLRQRYSPAVAAESIAWRRTWMELQDLGVVGDERLAAAQFLARAAESAGMRDVKVHIGAPDTSSLAERLARGGIGRKPASFSLSLEGRGGMASVIALLGRLPHSLTATRLDMTRQGRSARHQLSFAVYELTFENGPPTGIWSPAERVGAGAGGGRRPGG